jgi:hypothetical protein
MATFANGLCLSAESPSELSADHCSVAIVLDEDEWHYQPVKFEVLAFWTQKSGFAMALIKLSWWTRR